MEVGVIKIGDAPAPVAGKYSIHFKRSAGSDAKLQSSHFPGDATAWVDLAIGTDAATALVHGVMEVGGWIRLTGTDANAKLSYVKI